MNHTQKMLAGTMATILLTAALYACGGGNSVAGGTLSQTDFDTMLAKSTAFTTTASAASKANAQLAKVQLMAGVKAAQSSASDLSVRATLNAVDFGPCDDAGIKVGSTIKAGGSALDEQTQAFKQTPTQTCPGVNAEYDVGAGTLHTANRVYFTSNDCSGDPLIWDAGGKGFDDQKLAEGVSFINPMDGLQYWVAPNDGNVPTVQANSVYIIDNGTCTPDGDLQPMWTAVLTDFHTSGVPLTLGPAYKLSGL